MRHTVIIEISLSLLRYPVLVSLSFFLLTCEHVVVEHNSIISRQVLRREYKADSSVFYSFFKGKETLDFNEEDYEDSIVIEYNQYGLPSMVEEFYTPPDFKKNDLFGRRFYKYSVLDSTEIITHIDPWDGLRFRETRKFDSLGRVIYYKCVNMNLEVFEQYFSYDERGRLIK